MQQAVNTLQRSAEAMLEGSTVREIGHVGTLVIPPFAALTLGLA
jgi:hypothetical protein